MGPADMGAAAAAAALAAVHDEVSLFCSDSHKMILSKQRTEYQNTCQETELRFLETVASLTFNAEAASLAVPYWRMASEKISRSQWR